MATVRSALEAAIKAARASGRLEAWHEPDAAIALKLAGALGKRDTSIADTVRLSGELRKVLDALPLAPATAPKGVNSDDGVDSAAGRAGPGDARPLGLAPGLGAGPAVGDTALPT